MKKFGKGIRSCSSATETMLDPLSAALEGSDPLSQLAAAAAAAAAASQASDPPSQMAEVAQSTKSLSPLSLSRVKYMASVFLFIFLSYFILMGNFVSNAFYFVVHLLI